MIIMKFEHQPQTSSHASSCPATTASGISSDDNRVSKPEVLGVWSSDKQSTNKRSSRRTVTSISDSFIDDTPTLQRRLQKSTLTSEESNDTKLTSVSLPILHHRNKRDHRLVVPENLKAQDKTCLERPREVKNPSCTLPSIHQIENYTTRRHSALGSNTRNSTLIFFDRSQGSSETVWELPRSSNNISTGSSPTPPLTASVEPSPPFAATPPVVASFEPPPPFAASVNTRNHSCYTQTSRQRRRKGKTLQRISSSLKSLPREIDLESDEAESINSTRANKEDGTGNSRRRRDTKKEFLANRMSGGDNQTNLSLLYENEKKKN